MSSEQLYNDLLELIEKSESRMDKTNEMVQALARTCENNMNMYDKHLVSLENSRNTAQMNAASSIEVSKNLTELMTTLRTDYQSQLAVLKGELHSLRDEYKQELADIREDYRKLAESYTRLAERGHGSKAEVKINH